MTSKKQEISLYSLKDKIKMVERIWVIHPQMQAILDKIDYCREHAKYALESVGMLVIGDKGVGKTTIKDLYVERNAHRQTKTATFVPVLHIRIPVPATVGGLNTCLLTALNDPFPNSGSLTGQTLRVYKLIGKCQVGIVMFDEFQHFAERESFKLNRTVSDWTKNFMGESGKPLILFGTPKSEAILDGQENEQLRRRFPFRMKLMPFSWVTNAEQDVFRKFLEMVDSMIPLPSSSNLADPNMAARIHFATAGNMNEIMRLIRAAAVLALQRESAQISLNLLRESFEENLATNAPNSDNPFRQ